LRGFGKSFEDTSEGFSCKRTVLEARTVKVDGRVFLFLGNKGDVRLKLEVSLASAKKLAKQRPDVYGVGGGGWTRISLAVEAPPRELLEKWIEESYGLVAGVRAKKKTKAKAKKKRRR
jgi:predicted DNA-binding protein (MmcQ/YjbR family)